MLHLLTCFWWATCLVSAPAPAPATFPNASEYVDSCIFDLSIVGLKTLSSCLCIFQLCQSSIPSVGQHKMNQSVTVSHTSCLDEAFEFDLKRNLKLQNYPLQHRAAKSSLGNCFALFAYQAQNVKAHCGRCITYTRHEAHRSLISLNECTVHAFVTRPYMYV